jgi:hypothetical protein
MPCGTDADAAHDVAAHRIARGYNRARKDTRTGKYGISADRGRRSQQDIASVYC